MASFLILLFILPAADAGRPPSLDAARSAFFAGQYDSALKKLTAAEKEAAEDHDLHAQILWYRGAIHHAQGHAKEAQQAFDELLTWEPLFAPQTAEAAPDLRAVFRKRSEAFQAQRGVSLGVPVPLGTVVNMAILGHADEVASLSILAGAREGGAWTSFPGIADKGQATFRLDQPALWEATRESGRLLCVVEARNARGGLVARAGVVEQPLVMVVTPEQASEALRVLQGAGSPAGTPAGGTAAQSKEAAPPGTAESSSSRPRILRVGGGILTALGAGLVLPWGLTLLTGAALLASGVAAGVRLYALYGAAVDPNQATYLALFRYAGPAGLVVLAATLPWALLAAAVGIPGVGMLVVSARGD